MLALIPLCCMAQTEKDSLVNDTTKAGIRKYMPTGLRVGTDMIALVRSYSTKNFNGYEWNADLDFHRYYLSVDYGEWSRNLQDTSGTSYSNDGRYFRIGADVNFLLKDPDRNMFFIGGRYGSAVFSESLSVIQAGDSVWGFVPQQNYTNTNLKSRWFELTGGIRVKIWKFIWMGYTARFKFALKTSDSPAMLSHDVPGYGRTDKNNTWGFNYQLFIRIPFRKP